MKSKIQRALEARASIRRGSATVTCLVALLSPGLASSTPGDPLRPNIILVMADDMGWGDPSFNNGWIPTPALDAMAGNGLQFNRFYAASAVCSPTRASCLTGRNPFRVGVPFANQGHLGTDETPLSEVLKNAGYQCAHFGKWHLGTLTTITPDSNRGGPGGAADYSAPWHHSYDYCFVTEAKVPTYHPMRIAVNGAPLPVSFTDSNFFGARYWLAPSDPLTWPTAAEGKMVALGASLTGDDSRVIVDRVIPFMSSAATSGEPFFIAVWFHTPHKPVVDPQEVDGVDSSAAYLDSIQDLDAQVGRLRAELGTLGIRDNTMLWFCSDNGPEDGLGSTGGLRGRKRSLHEGGVRVPSLLEWPAMIPGPRVTEYPCVTSDYYPTIVEALDLTVPNQKPIDGISLMPLINDQVGSTRDEAIGFLINSSRSWLADHFKLISKNDGATYELYDLLADPAEQVDLSASRPWLASGMKWELETWIAAVNADTPQVSSGTQYCAGDGVAPHTPCPCANDNSGAMGGCGWGDPAFPEGGVLTAIGSDGMAANHTLLFAHGVSNNFGIFFGANNQVNGGNGNVLNDGLRCAGGGLVRLIPPTTASGNQAITPQPLQTLDTGAAAGVTRRYQYWFRTPGGPCSQMANLTNGYEIAWMP